jgi:ribosome biogenesis protein SSF1/2
MNNISTPGADATSTVPRHLEFLTTTVFQSLFPRINPQTTPLKSIRRVLLLNRETDEDGSFVLHFRHYAITTKAAGMSKPLRRLNAAERIISSTRSRKGGVPNLGRLEDISDYMIGGENGEGYMTDGTSGSEADTDAEVEVLDTAPRKVSSAKARASAADEDNMAPDGDDDERVERRRVTLTELGPRMKLRMTKVEEGLCSGKIMLHEHIHKSRQEIQELEKKWEKRRQEKENRRKEQKANVERKKKEKAANGNKGEEDDEDEEMNGNNSDLFDEMMEEDEFDSEGLAGDAEEAIQQAMEEDEWEDE